MPSMSEAEKIAKIEDQFKGILETMGIDLSDPSVRRILTVSLRCTSRSSALVSRQATSCLYHLPCLGKLSCLPERHSLHLHVRAPLPSIQWCGSRWLLLQWRGHQTLGSKELSTLPNTLRFKSASTSRSFAAFRRSSTPSTSREARGCSLLHRTSRCPLQGQLHLNCRGRWHVPRPGKAQGVSFSPLNIPHLPYT